MLGKLLKHEWRAVWKIPTLLIGILLAVAVLSGLSFTLPIWDSEWIGLPLSGMMLFVLFYVCMIGLGLGITIYLAVRYYKSMFTDEGYLTHTLPVTSHQLLLSKVITMSVWELIGAAAVAMSMVVFGGIVLLSLAMKQSSFALDFMEAVSELWELWESPYLNGFLEFAVSIVCLVLVSAVGGAMIIIGAVNLGQMARSHRILGAVGAYFGLNSVLQFISWVIMIPLMLRMMQNDSSIYYDESPFHVFTIFYVIEAVLFLLVSVGLYFLSEYLLRRQLELE